MWSFSWPKPHRFRRVTHNILHQRFKVFVFGTIGTILAAVIVRKLYVRRKRALEEQAVKDQLEKNRKARRERARTSGAPQPGSDNPFCVVCVTNPKEVQTYFLLCFWGVGVLTNGLRIVPQIICLPCGHVCMCEDCATKINDKCPVCRTTIKSKAAAFIS